MMNQHLLDVLKYICWLIIDIFILFLSIKAAADIYFVRSCLFFCLFCINNRFAQNSPSFIIILFCDHYFYFHRPLSLFMGFKININNVIKAIFRPTRWQIRRIGVEQLNQREFQALCLNLVVCEFFSCLLFEIHFLQYFFCRHVFIVSFVTLGLLWLFVWF